MIQTLFFLLQIIKKEINIVIHVFLSTIVISDIIPNTERPNWWHVWITDYCFILQLQLPR